MGKKNTEDGALQKNVKPRSPKLCGTNYPLSIAFIVVNEFCERFSYYGMKALLTLYFLNYLHWDENLSTAVYHAFSGLCYFTPLIGALIADSWLGKFKTIIYLSIVYVIGHVVKSVGAIPDVGDTTVHVALSMLGLVLIAIGTGGIKPCVAAFGGDQFEEEHMEERTKFFSIFYMSINAGSVLSTVITPMLRGDVQCFGGDCYALAFGVPAALMVIALVVFIAGSRLYKRSPPQGNILLDVLRCIGFALKNRWRSSSKAPKRKHWLDWAEEKYSKRLIYEIKMVLRVLLLYVPLPMFWALFDQQGSRWTLQATRMNMDFSGFILKPDQMQMLNALLILVFVPIFDICIYPLIRLCKINLTPLKKMAAGMVLAALAFVAAALVEINVTGTVVTAPMANESLLQILNLAGEEVTVDLADSDIFPKTLSSFEDPWEYQTLNLWANTTELNFTLDYKLSKSSCQLKFTEKEAYSLALYEEDTGIKCKLITDVIEKSDSGYAGLRFINGLANSTHITVGSEEFENVSGNYGVSMYKTVQRGEYSDVKCRSGQKEYAIDLGLLDFGASYTVIITQVSGDIMSFKKMEDIHANNVHIAWQIPQYVLITAGEVMFSITGLEFSYSQAPATMKSVLQAGWLMTVAFGNVIVLIVAKGGGLEQWAEFVLFAALLVGVCILFSIIAHFYTYVDPDELARMVDEEENEDLKKNGTGQPCVHMDQMVKSTKM
uniref:Solute carrier family 15 member 2 n=1 Tax=Lepisosteus oculatus TaxID=7918 RepID=W5M300_LEPOC|nr:PREDICTED: solute carrier family 15 member 2 [Lepisosteus oculatus]